MNILIVLSVVAVATAKPYAFSAIAPLSSMHHAVMPYSIWGSLRMMYGAHALHHTPLIYTSAPIAIPAVGVKSQYHVQDIVGQASYGHTEPMQSHSAIHDAAGNKVGSFSYVKPDGSIARTDYVADALGYRVASNDLPVAPMKMPLPVADTPEVMAARAAHLAEVAKIRSRARRHAIIPASTSPLLRTVAPLLPLAAPAAIAHAPIVHVPLTYSNIWAQHIPIVTPSGHIADAPDVAIAKAAHLAEHARAAARTQAIPVITPSGHLADAPDVAAAKMAHFAEHAKAAARVHAVPVITPSGHLADTPAVAAAKMAHFAELAKAAGRIPTPPADTPEVAAAKVAHFAERANIAARSALPHHLSLIAPAGHIADTPAVAAAKMAHYAEHANAAARNLLPVSHLSLIAPAGHIADTPEVAAAKMAHYAEHANAAARNLLPASHLSLIAPAGHIADTPEVAAAKMAHYGEHVRAALRG